MYKVTRPFNDRVTNRAYLTGDIYTAEDARIRELLFGQYPAIKYVAQPDMPETVQPVDIPKDEAPTNDDGK